MSVSMIRTLLLIVFSFSLLETLGQIPNANFELWTNNNPDYCQTTNIPIVPAAVLKDSDAYSGTYAAKGIVVNSNNHPFPPYLALNGGSATGFQVTQAFADLNGFCKLFLQQGDHFQGIIHLYNINNESIATGTLVLENSITAWTPFSIHINYFTADIPHYCAIYFTITDSTLNASGKIGSFFILDALSLSGISDVPTIDGEELISAFPNPASDIISINCTAEFSSCNYSIYDIAGKKIITDKFNGKNISLGTLLPGIYFIALFTEDKKIIKKIVKE